MSQDKEQQFVNNIRQSLDQSVEELDAVTRARLRAARLSALEAGQKRPVWHNRLALASAMSVTLVVGVWMTQKTVDNDLPIDDLQILTSNDDLEMYRDLEFYQWLMYQNEPS